MSENRRTSFVVRVAEHQRGRISGVVEQVATGAKEAFTDMDEIGGLISRMLQSARALQRAGPDAPSAGREKPRLGKRARGGAIPEGASDRPSDQPCDAEKGENS